MATSLWDNVKYGLGGAIDQIGNNLNNPLGKTSFLNMGYDLSGKLMNPATQVYAADHLPTNGGASGSWDTPAAKAAAGGVNNNPNPNPAPNPNPGDGGVGAANDEARRREEETRNSINSGYDQYTGGLKTIEGGLNTAQVEDTTSASKIYDQIFGGLSDQKQTSLDKLDASKGEVKNREATSIKDLQQNLGNVVRGMSMQMGALGAGDTSATKVMMPYAYTKIAGQQEGGIRNQSNQQLFEIDQQAKDTDLEFTKMWRETEVEKETKLTGIRQYYGDAIRNVQTAMAQAPLEKQNALAQLNQSLLAEAQANLRNLEAEVRTNQTKIRDWATSRIAALDDAKLKLSGNANFDPREITFNELQMQNAPQVTAQRAETTWNPLAVGKKVRDEYYA